MKKSPGDAQMLRELSLTKPAEVMFWLLDRPLPGIQYRHLIPAPVDWTSVSAWLYKHPWITCQKRPNTSMTHVAGGSMLQVRSVVTSGACCRIHA